MFQKAWNKTPWKGAVLVGTVCAVGVYVHKQGVPGAAARVPGAEHCVQGMDGVREAIEEINGVSWRHAAA